MEGGKDDGKIVVTVDSKFKDRMPKFLQSRQKDAKEMEDSVKQGDYPSIKMQGGMIKKSSETFGLEDLKNLGQAIETAANLKDSGKIKELLQQYSDYVSKLEIQC
ncbi:Hpt domain-containing protein [Candidatus Magnetomonas plexicatena]|uniref:Hpt domain-containing protein n=1 Tax=Candidatus Magnetomonas plexicatena TaxID=2552947 RepID=UPI001C784900|nr:hypothetical protein E2O03_008155 [Nitrospirales bacterium LBB_01]